MRGKCQSSVFGMLPMQALVLMTDTDGVGFKTPMTMPQASSKDIGRGTTLSGKSCCGSIAICLGDRRCVPDRVRRRISRWTWQPREPLVTRAGLD